MENQDTNLPVVIAVTSRKTALIRDIVFQDRAGWMIWNDGACDINAEKATQEYERSNYILRVSPIQVNLMQDPWGTKLKGDDLDDHIEKSMKPLLDALVASAGYKFPKLPRLSDSSSNEPPIISLWNTDFGYTTEVINIDTIPVTNMNQQ